MSKLIAARTAALKDIAKDLEEQGFNISAVKEVWHVNQKILMSKPLRLKIYNVFNDYQKINCKNL